MDCLTHYYVPSGYSIELWSSFIPGSIQRLSGEAGAYGGSWRVVTHYYGFRGAMECI